MNRPKPKGRLRPFWSYFGGKHIIARRYPKPMYDTIVEPFAGAAGYSTHYPNLNIILVERDPRLADMWRYITHVSEKEILSLPILKPKDDLADFKLSQEANAFMGYVICQGRATPARVLSPFAILGMQKNSGWGEGRRAMIASQLQYIRHWKIIEGDYTAAPDIEATWYIDPPYQVAGDAYRYSSKMLDFDMLGRWCRRRRGQVMVCENSGATWLPFKTFSHIQGLNVADGGKKMSTEVLFYREGSVVKHIRAADFNVKR